jgi:low temperature requirement protein LtrA
VWAGVAIAWIVGMLLAGRATVGLHRGMPPTESLVERCGLFTIIVLGEVVFGVVGGLSSVERNVKTITTGMIALWIGLGLWWIYFDLVGRRLPRNDGRAMANWLLSHLPITLSTAAAGGRDGQPDRACPRCAHAPGMAWLLAGAAALGLLALAVTERTLVDDDQRLVVVYQPLSLALGVAAAAALVVGWARPAPWLLALLLVAILSALWFFAVSRFLRADAWGEEQSRAD